MTEQQPTSESVIVKIKKLLALSRKNSNVNEAASAAAKAQELIMQYNLSQEEVEQFQTRAERITQEFYSGHRANLNEVQWKIQLAFAVGRSNLCKVLHHPWKKEISWIGTESNIEISKFLYETLAADLESMADKMWKDILLLRIAEKEHDLRLFSDPTLRTVHGKTWKKSFFVGAVKAISDRLRENLRDLRQNNENINALVLVNDTAVDTWIKDHYGRLGKGKYDRGSVNGSAYAAGIAAGKRIQFKRGMGAGGVSGPALLKD